jgi:hypothetical protein
VINGFGLICNKIPESFEMSPFSGAGKHPNFPVTSWSSRRKALLFRHTYAPHTYEERKVKRIFLVNPTFSLKGIPSFALPLRLGQAPMKSEKSKEFSLSTQLFL